MKRFLRLSALILLGLPTVAATWDVYSIEEIEPDEDNMHRDTRVKFHVVANETSDFSQSFWLQHPDDTWEKIETRTDKINKDEERAYFYDLPKEKFDQFGVYTLKFNESIVGRTETLDYTLPPNPDLTASIAAPIYINNDIPNVLVEVDVDDRNTGSVFENEHLNNGTVTLFKITRGSNGNLNQTKFQEHNLTLNEKTHALKALVKTENLEKGNYEYVANFTISSPPDGKTENYTILKSGTFQVLQNYGRDNNNLKWGDDTAETIKQNVTENVTGEAETTRRNTTGGVERVRKNLTEKVDDKIGAISLPSHNDDFRDLERQLEAIIENTRDENKRKEDRGGGFLQNLFSVIPFL